MAAAVSERRRAEIAEKRARLAALKAAREQRELAARAALADSHIDSSASSPRLDPGGPSRASPVLGASDGEQRTQRASLGASSTSRGDEIDSLLRGVGVPLPAGAGSPSSCSRDHKPPATPPRVGATEAATSPRAEEGEGGHASRGTSGEAEQQAIETPPRTDGITTG